MLVFHKGDGTKLSDTNVTHLPRKGDVYRHQDTQYQITDVIWDYGSLMGPVVVLEVDDFKD